MQCIHIPEVRGGMRTSSRMLSPCWTTCVSAQTAAVLEISLAAARTATTTTAPAPSPLAGLSDRCSCRPEPAAASVIALVAAGTTISLLPAGSEHLPVSETRMRKETKAMAHRTAPSPCTHRPLLAVLCVWAGLECPAAGGAERRGRSEYSAVQERWWWALSWRR